MECLLCADECERGSVGVSTVFYNTVRNYIFCKL